MMMTKAKGHKSDRYILFLQTSIEFICTMFILSNCLPIPFHPHSSIYVNCGQNLQKCSVPYQTLSLCIPFYNCWSNDSRMKYYTSNPNPRNYGGLPSPWKSNLHSQQNTVIVPTQPKQGQGTTTIEEQIMMENTTNYVQAIKVCDRPPTMPKKQKNNDESWKPESQKMK